MMKIHVVQAEEGDSFLLEYGDVDEPKYFLVDGGPKDTYDDHLRDLLTTIKADGGELNLVVLSHVDNDHVIGILDMIAELRAQRENGDPETIQIASLWHNSFGQTLGDGTDIEPRLKNLMGMFGASPHTTAMSSETVNGIKEGNQLTINALAHDIPINTESQDKIISVEEVPNKVTFENLDITIVGPTKETIKKLQDEWISWIESQENAEPSDPYFASMTDDSFRNLSSIMFLAESEGKSLLMTGDGRGDHLIEGLKMSGVMNNNTLHVDVLKVPHHGSDRNVTKKFFKEVTADTYIFSGNGKHGNPDLATLIWVVEAAQEEGRQVKLVVTNETLSRQKLIENYPEADYTYTLEIMPPDQHVKIIDLLI
jgi:hypothetical protein